jgi:GxxExxY protein
MENIENEFLAKNIFEASLEIHRCMGPGLLQSVYECCLIKEFELRKIEVKSQVSIPIIYKG